MLGFGTVGEYALGQITGFVNFLEVEPQAEAWTERTAQSETWTEVTPQAETWTET
mgnify:CR=1 FL=1